MIRYFGFNPDPEGVSYPLKATRSTSTQLSTSDLTVFREGRVYQGQIGCCVFSSIKRAIQLRTKILNGSSALISDICAYAIGRKSAVLASGKAPELLPSLANIGDVGANPSSALQALRIAGVVPESSWPGPASGRTDWDAMLGTEPLADVLSSAYDLRGLEFVTVDLSLGLLAGVRASLKAGRPVMLAINASYLNDPGDGVVETLPTSGQNHYVLILSADNNQYALLDNWWNWDEDWGIRYDSGIRGCWWCSWSALENGASAVLALTGIPGGFVKGGAK